MSLMESLKFCGANVCIIEQRRPLAPIMGKPGDEMRTLLHPQPGGNYQDEVPDNKEDEDMRNSESDFWFLVS